MAHHVNSAKNRPVGKPLSAPSAAPAGEPTTIHETADYLRRQFESLGTIDDKTFYAITIPALKRLVSGDAVPRTPEPDLAWELAVLAVAYFCEGETGGLKRNHVEALHREFKVRAEAVTAQLREEIAALRKALDEIAYGKQHSGVIPCPQDYEFYIKPYRDVAAAALKEKP